MDADQMQNKGISYISSYPRMDVDLVYQANFSNSKVK